MKEIVAVVVFCLILFIYLHVHFHLKQVNDLEIYELCQPSKERLEEVCDFRQPVVTDFNNDNIIEKCNLNYIKENYTGYDIKIRNVKEQDDDTELYIPLGIVESIDLFKKDKESKYMSENNYDFLDETGIIKLYRNNDMFLRPSMVSSCNYDILFGSLNVETPLRYEVNYRNYFVLTHGKAVIRLLVPKSKKYLYPINDYDNFEFVSPVNPWNVQDEYRADFNKLRTIDVNLISGQMIHIPAYWWYSIKYVKSNTTICVFKYKTYMNTLAISNHLVMRLLQKQNTKRVVASKMNIIENKNNKNIYKNKNEDINEEISEFVSIQMPPSIGNQDKDAMFASVSTILPNVTIPIPHDTYQKTNYTLNAENILLKPLENDDNISKNENNNEKHNDTHNDKSNETEIIVNL
jgi:hypothetical protein